MKKIVYQHCVDVNYGTDENPQIVQKFYTKVIESSNEMFDSNLAIAQAKAYNGEVTVEEIEDPVTEPTQLDMIEAQVAYTAMMTDTLLE